MNGPMWLMKTGLVSMDVFETQIDHLNLQALISINQPVGLTEERVRRLRMSAYAAARAQDYTQCVVLAAVLLRCTNLPSYAGSSVYLLIAQGLQNVCGLAAAVPYYEYVLEYWQGLSAPHAGDEGNADRSQYAYANRRYALRHRRRHGIFRPHVQDSRHMHAAQRHERQAQGTTYMEYMPNSRPRST